MPAEHINVSILDRDYRLACEPVQKPALLAAVSYVDRKMREIHDSSKVIGNDRIAVLAALNIANELLSGHAPIDSASSLASDEFKRRIQTIHAVIDAALAPQENLF